MKRKTIIDFLNEQAADAAAGSGHVSFHMPGHKGRSDIFRRAGYGDFLNSIAECDITEIPGADALFCPESTLLAVMENYAELYGVRHTELLVNGSSAGVMAAIIGSIPVGGKLILGRNSHHSAYSAMRLGGINPVYVRPTFDRKYGLEGAISPDALEKACEEHPDAGAVLITSPNYYGMMSDIGALAEIAHRHDMLLIVDQAHGAHLRFFDYDAEAARESGGYVPHPKHSAESLGADIVINSTHKTLFSFTGSGILNICTDAADRASICETLRMLQTTSPSYILMGSLDINERIMREYHQRIINAWKEDLNTFYRRASRITGLTTVRTVAPVPGGEEDTFPMYKYRSGMDLTKINISMASIGFTGEKLERELRRKGIIAEMVHGDYVMLMTGAGSRTADYEKLLAVLREISDNYSFGTGAAVTGASAESIPDFALEAADVPYDYEELPLYQAIGRILYSPIIIYPPGSPAACPGEILTDDVISYIASALSRGEKVTGVDEEGMIKVGVY